MNNFAKERAREEPFDFKKALQVFLDDAEVFDGYYNIELELKVPPEYIGSQVCWQIRYRSRTKNEIGDNTIEQLLVPKTSDVVVGINAPPVVPHIVDEFMPQDLWEVVESDNPSRAPTIDELKCIEFSIQCTNTFANGSERKIDEIYRVDLTKNPPVVYKREIIPENEQQRHDGMGFEDEVLTALLNFVQPFPRFKYVEVEKLGELERITSVVADCRRLQMQGSNNASEAGK